MTHAITLRSFTWSDLPRMYQVYCGDIGADPDEQLMSEAEFNDYFRTPNLNPEITVQVAQDENGIIVGYSEVEEGFHANRVWSDCVVDPAYQGRGIGTLLLREGDAHALRRADEVLGPDAPLMVLRGKSNKNVAAIDLFCREGYTHIRTFYRMQRDLTAPIDDIPPMPEGIELRPFDTERDAHALYTAQQETFHDHWGFVPDSFEYWHHHVIERTTFNPALILVAYEGDEIAGFVVGRQYSEEAPEQGWINYLGVRRPYRKHGLGMALLKRGFVVLREHGFQRAGLGVDATSITNAVTLYERAGMHVQREFVQYCKFLRGSAGDFSM